MVPHTLLDIAQTSVQIDIFHTFHDIRINKGAVFPKPCDQLLHLLALGSMDNITTVHRFPGSRPFFCDLLRKLAGTLEAKISSSFTKYKGRMSSIPEKLVL